MQIFYEGQIGFQEKKTIGNTMEALQMIKRGGSTVQGLHVVQNNQGRRTTVTLNARDASRVSFTSPPSVEWNGKAKKGKEAAVSHTERELPVGCRCKSCQTVGTLGDG